MILPTVTDDGRGTTNSLRLRCTIVSTHDSLQDTNEQGRTVLGDLPDTLELHLTVGLMTHDGRQAPRTSCKGHWVEGTQ